MPTRLGFVELIQRDAGTLKLRPDQKIVHLRWEDEKTRLAGVAKLLQALVKIARAEKPDADVAWPPPPPTPPSVKRNWREGLSERRCCKVSGRSRFAG